MLQEVSRKESEKCWADLGYLQQSTPHRQVTSLHRVNREQCNMEAAFRANQVDKIKSQMMQVSMETV